MNSTKLEVFGHFQLNHDGARYSLSRRKSQALVTVLAFSESHGASRSFLSQLLWSAVDDSAARTSLRQEISRLRTALSIDGRPLISGDKHSLWLENLVLYPSHLHIYEELSQSRIPALLLQRTTPQDQFLSHIEGLDRELDVWIGGERGAFESHCTAALLPLMRNGSTPEIRYDSAQALVNLEPSNEEALGTLMKIQVSRGAKGKAQEIYDSYCRLVREEYGLEPSQELRSILNAKPNGDSSEKNARETLQPVELRPLIGARQLSFPSGENSALMSGMRDRVLGALARFKDWSVREIGGGDDLELSANWFELRFASVGTTDTPRLGVTLFAKPSSEILWNGQVDCNVGSDESTHKLVRQLTGSIEMETSSRRLEQMLDLPESNRSRQDRWLLAKTRLNTWRADDEAEAEAGFRAILAKWPNHAPAISSLVEILNTRHHIYPGLYPDQKRSEEALKLAWRAARISPSDHRAKLALGWSNLMLGRAESALRAFEETLNLNDIEVLTVVSSAMGICYCGDHNRASALIDDILENSSIVEPVHWAYIACIRYYASDFDLAWKASSLAKDSAHFAGGMRAATAAKLGHSNEARLYAKEMREQISKHWYANTRSTLPNIGKWLVASFPIQNPAHRQLLVEGLTAAGILPAAVS